MVLPTPRLGLVIILAGLATGLLVALEAATWVPWGALGICLGAALVDVLWMVRPRQLRAVREMPERLGVGAANEIPVRVENLSDRPVEVRIYDEAPLELAPESAEARVVVGGGAVARGSYSVTPKRRGAFEFGGVNLRWRGPLGLVMVQRRFEQEESNRTARAYPRYVDYSRFLLESRIKLRREGPQRQRMAQRADEFESLRDYVHGDDVRRVDWKATARQHRLIVRNYEEERSKDVMILIDAGRMMAPEADGLTKLDRAINAAVMLASVAAERKDKVGLFVFADEPIAFLPPASGKDQVRRFLDVLYDVQVRLAEPDFARGFGYFKTKLRKRAMVILFTDLIDREASAQLLGHVGVLTQQHLPLCITIRDQSLERAATGTLGNLTDIYRRAVAEQVIHDRDIALAQLRKRGARVMDIAPDRLTVAAVNQYILMRRTGLL